MVTCSALTVAGDPYDHPYPGWLLNRAGVSAGGEATVTDLVDVLAIALGLD